MGISPWTVGDGKPMWTFSIEPDSGSFDITGLTTANFTLVFINTANQQPTTGTGTFSNLTASSNGGLIPASITYQVSTTDAAMKGMYDTRLVVNINTINQRTFKFGIWSNES